MRTPGAVLASLVVAFLCALILHAAAPQQVTANAFDAVWNGRTSTTSQGKVLWTEKDAANALNDVFFYDGTSVSTVQLKGALDQVTDSLFALGTGASPGDVIGAWRRGDRTAWLWTRRADATVTLTDLKYTNPFVPGDPMNPEAVAVADGCVFMALQYATGGVNVKHVFKVNPADGTSTGLTGNAVVPGAVRVATSGCKAAWVFDDGTGTPKLQFYNGAAVTQVDAGNLHYDVQLSQGRLVYAKTVSGVQQIFLYDSTLAGPGPVQLSTDASGSNGMPRTDGRHVAWVHLEADGITWNVVVNGGLRLTSDTSTRPQINVNEENTFQLQRGQLLWKDTGGMPRYYAGGRLSALSILPATSFERFWLADGFIASLGTGGTGTATDKEVFRLAVTTPAAAAQPASPMVVSAAPGANQATVRWDRIAGASSYNVYMAQQPGVTKDNYLTLAGGTRFTSVTTPFTATGLGPRGTYYFVVTAVEGATEGPGSPEAQATLTGSLTWTAGTGVPAVNVNAVAADRVNAAVAYAAAGLAVYKSTDSGGTWNPLAGGIQNLDIRALAAAGLNVYAATRQGDILRSLDGGASWAVVADGSDIGEQVKSLIIDPLTPGTLYAGNFELPTKGPGDSYILKSTNSGAVWSHLPQATVPGADLRAYTLSVDPMSGGKLYAGGTGTPTLARSGDGGTTWTAVQPASGSVLALAADSRRATSLYAGMMMPNNTTSRGLYKSTTEGASWVLKNTGFPATLPRMNALLADPANASYLHAGTDAGYFFSVDGAETWTAANTGLTDSWVNALSVTGSRRLLAGTSSGVFVLDLSSPAVPPSITTQPQSQTIVSGQTATLSVAATGTAPLGYQWYAGASPNTASPIGGATSSSYTTPALSSTTSYWVRITNADGFTNSNTAVITVVSCTYSLSAPSASVPSTLSSGSVTLTASAPACGWTAISNNAFITVTSPGAGTGSTSVTWSVALNPLMSPRTGTIAIAGLTFTITQAAASGHRVPNDFNGDGLSDLGVFRPSDGRWLIAGQADTGWGAAADMPVAGDFNGDGHPDIAVFRPANGTWYIKDVATIVWGTAGDIPAPGDFDGNGTTDVAVFSPSTGMFRIRGGATMAWGLAGDLPVVGDYDGDGRDDIAVYRLATGTWYINDGATVVFGFAADIPVPADYNGDGRTDIAVFRPATGTWLVKDQFTQVWGAAGDVPVPLDRDGDGRAELGVFRRGTATWYFKNHVTDTGETIAFGAIGDIPLNRAMPPVQTRFGDYDGDRKADLTVFRPSTGDWVSLRSLSGQTDYTLRTFGLSGDVPVGRDYDGDGKIDPAVFRPSAGRWFVLQSSTGYSGYVAQDWGLSTDTPVPADYDGDGRADFAVFRPSIARWVILLSSSNNTSYALYDWGLAGDIPVPADYDGDGRTDIAVFRPSAGRWFILNRLTGAYTTQDWGLNGDVPIAADFDGDGKADVAVFRPSNGKWFVTSSIDGFYQTFDWGLGGDVAVPADFDGDGKADVAVFRPTTGTWYVRGLFNRSWGLSGDIPALRNP